MTPLTKRRFSSRRQGKKRASLSIKLAELVECPTCHQPKRAHRACSNCA